MTIPNKQSDYPVRQSNCPVKHFPTDRKEHPVKILQFGEGNFLRAFFDWMIDISNSKGITDTSVAIVSPRFKANETIRNLQLQNGIFHVCLEGIENGTPKQQRRLVTSVTDAFSPVENPEKYISYITSPDLRFIVSNTTEAGICYEPDDITSLQAKTFPGKITALLYHRYRHFDGDPSRGLIFLSCELIENNGRLLREYVLRHAQSAGLEEDFIKWVKEDCIFCDTLVDRIVSGYPADCADTINAETGYSDALLVKGELYHLWVIGGENADKVKEELPLHAAGLNVHFMPSVKEFRDKKVRILNGSHTGMVPVALQLNCDTVLDAFNNKHVNTFISRMVENEVLPVIDGDPNELKSFADSILERFYNPYIRHMLRSISLNSLSKWETRNYPTVRDNWIKKGLLAEHELFTFAALLALYAPDSDFIPEDNSEHIKFIHDNWLADNIPATVSSIVRSGIFSENFENSIPGFCDKVSEYLISIRGKGMDQALKEFNESH